MFEDEAFQSFWGHVAELRKTLLRIFWIIGIGFILAICFYDQIFSLLTPPTSSLIKEKLQQERIFNPTSVPALYELPEKASILTHQEGVTYLGECTYQIESQHFLIYELSISDNKLFIMTPIEGVLLTFKVAFWISLALTSPLWVYTLLQFILPGLNHREKGIIFPFLMGSFVCLSLGAMMAYKISIPLANAYLEAFNASLGQNLWSLSAYIDYTLVLLLGHAVGFELCLILLFMVHFEVLSVEGMMSKRRYMIVLAFIIGAILTPPDIPTQLMLAFPLIGMYELAILYGKFRRSVAFKKTDAFDQEVIHKSIG